MSVQELVDIAKKGYDMEVKLSPTQTVVSVSENGRKLVNQTTHPANSVKVIADVVSHLRIAQ